MELEILNNLTQIQQRVELSCQLSGRAPEDVRVMAVSKKQPVETIKSAHRAGVKYFGENYVQELLEKKKQLFNLDITWDYIGRLQSNKVKDLVGQVDLIHSVDRIKILDEIEKQCTEKGIIQKVLLEVNFAGEESKAGFLVDEMPKVLDHVQNLEHIRPCGIMVMPPLVDNPEDAKPIFKLAKFMVAQVRNEMMWPSFVELSMGTSHDYQTAVQEFSTIVRIGTALLGDRPK